MVETRFWRGLNVFFRPSPRFCLFFVDFLGLSQFPIRGGRFTEKNHIAPWRRQNSKTVKKMCFYMVKQKSRKKINPKNNLFI